MKKRIFISYADHDKKKMVSLKKKIDNTNFLKSTVVAYDRRAMTPLSTKVIEGIKKSDFIIPLLTENSYQTQWINQEIGYATAINKKIMPIVEKSVISKLKGFIHVQMDLPYNYSSIINNSKKSRSEYRKCLDILINDLENLLRKGKNKKSRLLLDKIFKGIWKNVYEIPGSGFGVEFVEIKNGNKYFSGGKHFFNLDMIFIGNNNKNIRFRKNGIGEDNRKAFNDLTLIKPGVYSGEEDKHKITYTKLGDLKYEDFIKLNDYFNEKKSSIKSSFKSFLIVYRTQLQRTLLIADQNGLSCYLSHKDRNSNLPELKWCIIPSEAKEILDKNLINVNTSFNKLTGLFSIGEHKKWRYSKKIFPDHKQLITSLKNMLLNAAG